MTKIVPSLWFDGQAEEAARFYTGIFPNSRIGQVSRHDSQSAQASAQTPGHVLAVKFELDGRPFLALNGGPMFKFTEAISLTVNCDTQEELDRYWNVLSAGGQTQRCGWLKDKFGLSWQIVPAILGALMTGGSAAQAARVMGALLKMEKPDIQTLEAAAAAI